MKSWDPAASAHLRTVSSSIQDAGLVEFFRRAVQETWRINRERHEPDEAYDDNLTLAFQSARNLTNRIYELGRFNSDLQESGIGFTKDQGTTIVTIPKGRIRVMKAPGNKLRDDVSDCEFREQAEGRRKAAERNSAVYAPPTRQVNMEPLIEFPPPDLEAVRQCADFFLVWSADLRSNLTAGWLGLPSAGANPWIALTQVWRDDPIDTAHSRRPDNVPPAGDFTFGDNPVPKPQISLKPRRQEGTRGE